jgi:hypothetical protein
MKAFILGFLCTLVINFALIGIYKTFLPSLEITIVSKGDECPGITGTKDHPSDCKAYWDGKQVVLYNDAR